MKQDIKNFTLDELTEALIGTGKERFRARQIFKWIYKRDVENFEQMTDLSKDLRAELDTGFCIPRFSLLDQMQSSDGTRKLLFELHDGQTVETVLIPNERNRQTLCISSQVGCALACGFCRTGKGGFVRNLTAGEIVEQVLASTRQAEPGQRITNIVLMGMGEPLLNYDNTLRAIRIFYADDGLNYSARKITLSTAGIVPAIEQLGKEIEVSLAISLHATDNETRARLMPISKKYTLEQLLEACRKYPLGTRRRITFEYLLIDGINDSDEDARRLARLLAPIKAKINLIVFNPFDECEFKRPSDLRVAAFQKILLDRSVTAMLRKSRGGDILAACGQLRSKE